VYRLLEFLILVIIFGISYINIHKTFYLQDKTVSMTDDKNAIYTVLDRLGFSEIEAKVYLALLKLGPSPVLIISQQAGVKRSTTYLAIDSLQRKGLVNIEVKGLKKWYVAENPEKLEGLVEEYRRTLRESMPKLAALYNLKGSEGVIKYYQGIDGIRSAYEVLLEDVQPGDFYYSISEVGRWYELDPEYFENLRIRRAHKGLKIKILVNNTPSANEYKNKAALYNQEVKILPPGIDLTSTITLTPHKIIFHQIVPPVSAILMDNQSIIQVQKELFGLLWTSAQ
jgi:sugar-specific transcriptional regulator TrmB